MEPSELEELAAARDAVEAEDARAAAALDAGAPSRAPSESTLVPDVDAVEADEILLEGQQQQTLPRLQEPPSEISRWSTLRVEWVTGLTARRFCQRAATLACRQSQALLAIMQAGEQLEEAIAERRGDIDAITLELLARRMRTAEQLERSPEVLQGLQLLYRR